MLKITMLLASLSLIPANSWALCTYKLAKKDVQVNWTAYKLPGDKKAPVKGSLKKFTLKGALKGESAIKALENTEFDIQTTANSISTGDKARDSKIALFFFSKMHITGKVLRVTEKDTEVELSLNNVKQKFVMDNTWQGDSLTATAVIDVLHFKMDKNLESLTKACFEKHEGKTWPDVNIEIKGNFKKTCK